MSSCLLLILICAAFTTIGTASDPDKTTWAKHNAERLLLHGDDDPPMLLQAGGPDAYGYFFIDSRDNANNHPIYRWKNIAEVGVNLNLTEDDQFRGPFNIGFIFNYYGHEYSQLYVCSNGWIAFGSTLPEFLNRPMPTADLPNNILAVFWDDLVPGAGNAYRYSNDADSCIISWHNFGNFTGEGLYTFQVILTADGGIYFQYLSLSGTLDSYTIGIENSTGTSGLQYAHNTLGNVAGRAVYFGQRPPRYVSYDVMPIIFESPATGGVPGDSIRPTVRYFNNGAIDASFQARVTIGHGGTVYDQSILIGGLFADSFRTADFPWFHPTETGDYLLTATAGLSGDQRVINDTIRMTYRVFPHIYSNDFESDSTSFVGNNDWEWGHPTSGPRDGHSGENLWATDLDSNYTVGPLLSSLVTDTLLLDSGSVMTFWHWYDIEALYDGGNVKISGDDGATWNLLGPDGGYDGILSDVFYNPLADEPAFYGSSGGWLLETFDLSSYAGAVALIKFDFGSDNSASAPGWFIDDITILGASQSTPGWSSGVIRDLATSNPIPGAIVYTSRRADTCDTEGRFVLELLPGINAVTAEADFHNPVTADSIAAAAGETTYFDIHLPAPAIQADTAPIDTTVIEGRTATFIRRINNTGNGYLAFRVDVDYLPRALSIGPGVIGKAENPSQPDHTFQPLDFGDEVFVFDPQTPTGDIGCIGVEFDGEHFWVTGRHNIDDVHKLHKFDRQGQLLATYNQNTISDWGWRDLAWDGEFLYASDENELAQIDPASGQRVATLPMPDTIPPPIRALTFDPDSGHFWGANFSSNIIEFRRDGSVVSSFPNNRHIYGLAWDNASPGAPWLWVFSQDSIPLTQISQFDPRTGVYTGIGFQAADHNGGEPDLAGGACFTAEWDSSMGVLFCLVMGRTTIFDSQDRVQGYEIAPYSRWLSVSPHSGVIPPSGWIDLNITIDFTDSTFQPEQHFSALLTLTNNGFEQPAISLDVGVLSGIGDDDRGGLPRQFALHQNYPNPFNSKTIISFDLPQRSDIRIEIFDIQGRRVANLSNEPLPAGRHSIIWDASGLSSGAYFYRLNAGPFSKTGRMTLLK